MESCPSTETPAKTVETESNKKIIPFKLYFPVKRDISRSYGNYPTIVSTLAPKFYSKAYASFNCSERNLQNQINKLKFVGPREKFKQPHTESEKYGWYCHVKLRSYDKRLNFAKNTTQFIHEHLMNYAKIR